MKLDQKLVGMGFIPCVTFERVSQSWSVCERQIISIYERRAYWRAWYHARAWDHAGFMWFLKALHALALASLTLTPTHSCFYSWSNLTFSLCHSSCHSRHSSSMTTTHPCCPFSLQSLSPKLRFEKGDTCQEPNLEKSPWGLEAGQQNRKKQCWFHSHLLRQSLKWQLKSTDSRSEHDEGRPFRQLTSLRGER